MTEQPRRYSYEEIERHCERSIYGDFELTDAIRPHLEDLSDEQCVVHPAEGYILIEYQNVALLKGAVTRPKLFDVFRSCVELLGEDELIVTLKSSHDDDDEHHECQRDSIDLPVLNSKLLDHENVLLNDGGVGICVAKPGEHDVIFDEHKLLYVLGDPLSQFEQVFQEYGVRRNDEMKFITNGPHIHVSANELQNEFNQMVTDLVGIDSSNWNEDGEDFWNLAP